eukprot:352642-Chlamydomonas_euryale.AAC.1
MRASAQVSSLVPEALAALKSADEFMAALPAHDADIGRLASKAAEQGKVVRYIGRVDVHAKSCSVELTRLAHERMGGRDSLVAGITQGEQRQLQTDGRAQALPDFL